MSELTKNAADFIKNLQKIQRKPKGLQEIEKVIGRELEDYETVMFKDGNKHNTQASNLMVGFKAGVPYQFLTCRNCGARMMGLNEPVSAQRNPQCSEDG